MKSISLGPPLCLSLSSFDPGPQLSPHPSVNEEEDGPRSEGVIDGIIRETNRSFVRQETVRTGSKAENGLSIPKYLRRRSSGQFVGWRSLATINPLNGWFFLVDVDPGIIRNRGNSFDTGISVTAVNTI